MFHPNAVGTLLQGLPASLAHPVTNETPPPHHPTTPPHPTTTHQVTTVDGPVELKIPPGTQPGTTLLMAKRGVPRLGSPNVRGDHMVHVRVRIPKALSADERKLVEELKELQSKTKVGPFRF